MSETGGGQGGGSGPGRREVAYRLFAAEYDGADLSYSESDEERAPNYVVTPSGARVNRLFVVGVLTEVESVSEDYLRARVVDPTGPFVVYAGQYQPEAMRFLESAEPPTFVAVTGKARTFQPDDSDRVYTSIRPESINEVDAGTRDRWVIKAAEGTLDRVERVAEAKASGITGEGLRTSLDAHGVDEGLASGIPLALDHYGTSGTYLQALRNVALDALRVVAGERDEVESELPEPDQGGDDAIESLVERTIEAVEAEPAAADSVPAEPEPATEDDAEPADGAGEADQEEPAEPQVATVEGGTETDAEPTIEAEQTTEAEPATETESTTGAEPATETESTTEAETESSPGGIGDFDGEFDLDDEEREEIESEYGTEFKSGSEVEDPGEAGIDTPSPDDGSEPEADEAEDEGDLDADEPDTDETEGGTEPAETEPVDADEGSGDEGDAGDDGDNEGDAELDATAAEIALDDAVMDAMVDLDDGDGADRSAVVAEVVDATGADPGDVEDAIQDALMDGLCYEPEDGILKPI